MVRISLTLRVSFLGVYGLNLTNTQPADKEKKMGKSRYWFGPVRRKFNRKSHGDITIFHSPSPSQEAIIGVEEEISNSGDRSSVSLESFKKKELTKEDIAAIKIQANFRGHLVTYLTHCPYINKLFSFRRVRILIDSFWVLIIQKFDRQGGRLEH